MFRAANPLGSRAQPSKICDVLMLQKQPGCRVCQSDFGGPRQVSRVCELQNPGCQTGWYPSPYQHRAGEKPEVPGRALMLG